MPTEVSCSESSESFRLNSTAVTLALDSVKCQKGTPLALAVAAIKLHSRVDAAVVTRRRM